MKTKLFLWAVLFSGIVLSSCDDDNINVGSTVDNAFSEKYPAATMVTWERENGNYVADFWLDGKEAEATFTKKGKWVRTEIDVRYDELPEAVQDAFSTGDYAQWYIDDVDQMDYSDGSTKYIIEVEKGNSERNLHYAPDGTLIKTTKR